MVDGPPSPSSSAAASSLSSFRPGCLQGRVCLVTGGGSGICFEITRQLIRAGCAGAIICGRRELVLQQAVKLLREEAAIAASASLSRSSAGCCCRVDYQVCDVRHPTACEAVLEFVRQQHGRLDILVNGAAGNFLARADQLSYKGFATVLAIDTLGTFHMCRAAHSLLQQTTAEQPPSQHTAHIINISATLQYGATWWQAHASAAKAAIDSLTRSLALEWGEQNIRVNGIAPGPIANTPGTVKLAPPTAGAGRQQLVDVVQRGIPLGRMGDAREIGEAAVYLCTANYVTGHVLVVDGGEWLYRPSLIPADRVADLSRSVESQSRALVPSSSSSSPRPKL